MSATVGMLDLGERTLHRPGSLHLRTACGVELEHASVGPLRVTAGRAERCCPECFDVLADLLPALDAMDALRSIFTTERSQP